MIVDGLVVAKPNRELFESLKKGGLTAANFTCSIWESLEATINNVADWTQRFEENKDIIVQIKTVADIEKARDDGKVGIILGWQNSSGYGDYLPNVRLFKDLGVGIVQLTYNSANSVGGGCYESRDGGLSDFGRALVEEMNAAGVLVDLSHVGPVTSKEAIDCSKMPVAYTHCCPSALFQHPRNKSDDQLRYISQHDGFVGVGAAVPHFMPKGWDTTVDDFVDVLDHVRNIVGSDQIGLGTDLVQGQPPEFFDWIGRDKGTGRSVTSLPAFPVIKGFEDGADYHNIVRAIERRYSSGDAEKILGRNWLAFLQHVWRN
ncbi:membrane dipeptidase [Pseudorhodoplanes sp.]|uniref:membrane dipeptidase n=1 Tax=Pseudorhodoplanes sp. TaxID=1934341 RepID=UPI003D0BAAE7